MDITPTVNLLRSLRGDRISYQLLIAEAADNAFDADASNIAVEIRDQFLRFTDDGIGISKDRTKSIVSLGDHGEMVTTQLGRFGVGFKYQAINAADKLEVCSISQDGKMVLEADWRRVLASGVWRINDPIWLPYAVDQPSGSVFTITELRKASRWSLDRILESLALMFYPAIAQGRRITINGRAVPLLTEPKMSDIIDCQVSLSGGRSAHVRAGILRGASKLHHVHVSFRHRVLMPNTRLGCQEYSGMSGMFARVEVAGPWHFAKFKDDLPDWAQREELEEAVGNALRPILEKCNAASMTAEVEEMIRLVNDQIPPEFAARPRRTKEGPPNPAAQKRHRPEPGKVSPERSDASPTGPARAKRPPKDQLLITFDGNADQDGIGKFMSGRPSCVNLSKDHPHILELCAARDKLATAKTIYLLALMLFEEGRREHPQGEQEEMFPFGKRVADLLARQKIEGEAEQSR
jgi:hypothetical protein